MNGKNEIRVAELFAGIGGFRLGLEKANYYEYARFSSGPEQEERRQRRERSAAESAVLFCSGDKPSFRVVWANEWDKYAASIYRKNFGEKELVEGDITKIEADNIPDFDLLCGGFPCQPFSLAGKREGFKDLRGTMFFEIARIAEAKRPQLLLLENVKGLLSHDNGDTFETIIRTLDELGYDVEWQVFNSKYFGVPQNRERVFIVGHLRGAGTQQIFPVCEPDELSFEDATGEQRVSSCLDANYSKGARKQRTFIKSGGLHSNMTAILADNLGGNIKQRQKDVSSCAAWTLGGSKTLISHSVRSGSKGSLDRHSWDIVAQNQRIRRLTPTECERLQGFPDGWTEGVSDTQRYKCLGNAVTVNVIKFLGEQLLEVSIG